MREIPVSEITEAVKKLCISANYNLNSDVYSAIENSKDNEQSPIGKNILSQLLENADLAKENCKPICQDTGMAVIFMEVGQEVHFTGGNITDAINEGVRQGYIEGYLRKSVVSDPILIQKIIPLLLFIITLLREIKSRLMLPQRVLVAKI